MLSNLNDKALYSANGVTVNFAIPHDIIDSDSSEVEVFLVNEAVDPVVETLQVEGALQDYTLTGANPPTTPFDTHVTFNSAPASPLKILVRRKLALTQPVDLDTNGNYPAETSEKAYDRVVAQIQLLRELLSRSLFFRKSTSITDGKSLPDPDPGKFIRWKSDSTGLENADPIGGPGSDTITAPSSTTDNAVVRWDGTNGTIVQNSAVTISDTGDVDGVDNLDVDGDLTVGGTLNLTDAEVTNDLTVGNDLILEQFVGAKFLTSAVDGTVAESSYGTIELGQIESDVDTLVGSAIRELTGDVTALGTGVATPATIANDAVTNAKAANMATQTIKGRTTAGTGDPEDLTATQATAILNNFVGDSGSGGTKGLVPAPATGDAAADKFLHADGTWTVPAGSAGDGRLLDIQYFSADGTYNKNTDAAFIIVTVIGAGGSGGGAAATTTGNAQAGGGGGGGWAKLMIDNASVGTTETVTVGTGGGAATAGANAGNAGETSSFGAHCSATGGGAGAGAAENNSNVAGGAGGTGSGGDINGSGGRGGPGRANVSTNTFGAAGSMGGGSIFSASSSGLHNSAPAGSGYGCGSAGAQNLGSQSARASVAGNDGLIIVEEYS